MSDETKREQVMNFMARYLLIFKHNFKQRGGWSSKRNISVVLLLLWAFYTWMRERGFLPKKSVRGKHVFITGAGTGLGSLLALRFVQLGANVTVSGLILKDVNDTKRMIKTKTGADSSVLAVVLDVCNREMITNVIKQSTDQFGDVDILINNAGVVQGKAFMDLNEKFVSKTL
jgi:all-trans-retinol dehydrogenase (NAD+)